MSMYLERLIECLEADVIHQQATLKSHRAPSSRDYRSAVGHLARTLQRIKSLRDLQAEETRRHPPDFSVSNTRRRVSSGRGSKDTQILHSVQVV